MFKKNKKTEKVYGIVGMGRFGMALAIELAQAGTELIVLDKDEEKIREMREYTENAFVVRSLDKKALSETGIQHADVAVVAIGDDLDISILTTLHLVSFGIPTVISKAMSAEHGEILEKLGADVVYPERDMAVRLAHRLETAQVLDYIQLTEKLNISKQLAPAPMIGLSVKDANLNRRFGVNIIAIENGKSIQEVILPDYVFQEGDILFVSGSREGLNRFSDWV